MGRSNVVSSELVRGSQTSKIASFSVLNDLMGLPLPSAIVPSAECP